VQEVSIKVSVPRGETTQVSGLLEQESGSRTCLVFAHGAGAGMQHPFMERMAGELARAGVSTLRFQFPYMEHHSRRPDPPALCHATVRAAVSVAHSLMPGTALIAGGKSFGARMTSQAQALMPLPGVKGLVFFGFPLHQPNKPSADRGAHLSNVKIPMLFIQGTRDTLADLEHLRPIVERLSDQATLQVIDGADHSFHVLKRSGRSEDEARAEIVSAVIAWAAKII
jgi:predicted alpha/beta-hydrolase family hydrolase